MRGADGWVGRWDWVVLAELVGDRYSGGVTGAVAWVSSGLLGGMVRQLAGWGAVYLGCCDGLEGWLSDWRCNVRFG